MTLVTAKNITLIFLFKYDVWSSSLLNNVTFINFHRDTPPISDPNSATNCLTVLNNGPNPPYSRNTGISGVADLHFESTCNIVNDTCHMLTPVLFSDTDVEVRVQMTNESNRRTSNIIDFDGSLTGISSGAVVGSDQPFWKVGSDCTFRSDWLAWVCPLTSVSIRYIYSIAIVLIFARCSDPHSNQCWRNERHYWSERYS